MCQQWWANGFPCGIASLCTILREFNFGKRKRFKCGFPRMSRKNSPHSSPSLFAPLFLSLIRFPLQSLCPRGQSEHVSTFVTVRRLICLLLSARTRLEVVMRCIPRSRRAYTTDFSRDFSLKSFASPARGKRL